MAPGSGERPEEESMRFMEHAARARGRAGARPRVDSE